MTAPAGAQLGMGGPNDPIRTPVRTKDILQRWALNPQNHDRAALRRLAMLARSHPMAAGEYRKFVVRGKNFDTAHNQDKLNFVKVIKGINRGIDLSERVTAARLSFANDQVSQIVIEIEDPGLHLYRSDLFTIGAEVLYEDIPFVVSSCVLGDGQARRGGLTVTVRSAVIQGLKDLQHQFTLRNATPAEYVVHEVGLIGGLVVAQQDETMRTDIPRDFKAPGQIYTIDETPSAWTTIQKLAQQVGYMVYEAFGIIFFCKPSWLFAEGWKNTATEFSTAGFFWESSKSEFSNSRQSAADRARDGQVSKALQLPHDLQYRDGVFWLQPYAVPNITVATDQGPGPSYTVTLTIPVELATDFFIGQRAQIRGCGPTVEAAPLLISGIEFDLASDNTATITCTTPIDPLIIDKSNTKYTGQLGQVGQMTPGKYAGVYLDQTQLDNYATIVQTIWQMKELKTAGDKTHAVWTATCTAMVESAIHRWTSPAVPTSKNYPNDGPSPYGANYDSVGIYQQRANWGDVKSRMDAALSTINFIKTGPTALLKVANWRNIRPGTLAQLIQGSAYPTRYLLYETLARVLLAQYQAQAVVSTSLDGWNPGHPINTKRASDFVNIVLTQVGKAYVFGAGYPRGMQNPEPSYDCSSLVQWGAFQVGLTMPRIAQDQYNYCVSRNATIPVSQALATRGALLYHTPGSGSPSDISHTGISLGDGRTVEAYDTGIGVIIGGRGSKYASEHWEFAGLMPGAVYR